MYKNSLSRAFILFFKNIFIWIKKKFIKEKSLIERLELKNSGIKKLTEKFLKSVESEILDDALFVVLELFSLVFAVDKNFRRNIENFNGRYLFNSVDKKIEVAAVFKNGKMKVKSKKIENADVTVTFKDVPSLMRFVTSKDPNILSAVLDQTIIIDGNLNYIYKFGYMIQHLAFQAKNWYK